jgi:pimeloyl-ACP methyl ester carboxylesterase
VTTVAVVHGAGSSPGVARAAFVGGTADSFWLAGHGPAAVADDDGATDRRALAALVQELRPDVVAGISYGAHQVARWAAAGLPPYVTGLALVMPAWLGEPGPTAAATVAQADAFARVGVAAELARIVAAYPGWVADALAGSWPQHDDAQVTAALRAVARSTGPTPSQLAAITVPTAVVALAGDPLHPAAVAEAYAAGLPDGRFVVVDAGALGDLGDAALGALGWL